MLLATPCNIPQLPTLPLKKSIPWLMDESHGALHHAGELNNFKNSHARAEEEDKLQMVKPSVKV
jgi:hypothetical protein